ncbi:MAG: hypothetical protein E3J47_04695 [Candidatus Stahlbacteria bacterium]|nr:MAG: hypothetical protein E3J47_04695 [Candidatus Stahlbacteria bacterium]
MREIINISINDIKPARDDVLKTQGVPAGSKLSGNVKTLFKKAMALFIECVHPVGIISEISIPEFNIVYAGEGLNEKSTPLDAIIKKADNLVLFALTIGENVTEKINELFKTNEFALGTMLDAVASVGTDNSADCVEKHFTNVLRKKGKITLSSGTVRYSTGYCGWHMSGQKKLFGFLHPENIGIMLLDSYLMKPLKSISGVIVVGEKEIHRFKDSYPFCSDCKTHSCRKRIKALFDAPESHNKEM